MRDLSLSRYSAGSSVEDEPSRDESSDHHHKESLDSSEDEDSKRARTAVTLRTAVKTGTLTLRDMKIGASRI